MTNTKSSNVFFIGNLGIGSSVRPKIIAEIGINHGGCLDTAKKMSELAVEAGADIVKTQMHIPDEEMSDAAKKLVPVHCSESIYDIIANCSLPIDKEYELMQFIRQLGVEYLCTPFSSAAAHILGRDFRVNCFKIGSGECNNDHLLKTVSSYKKPLIISTGMNSLASCRSTYQLVTKEYQLDAFFLHTTNLYPTPHELVRLGCIKELQELAGIDFVGLSDHTDSNLACLGAVALGAVLIERHFTDSKDRTGPDISNSMDPFELKELRLYSEQMYLMRGGSKESMLPQEEVTRQFAFATFVATTEISIGDTLTVDNIVPKRPGLGDFYARDHALIIGKKVKHAISKGDHILRFHLEL